MMMPVSGSDTRSNVFAVVFRPPGGRTMEAWSMPAVRSHYLPKHLRFPTGYGWPYAVTLTEPRILHNGSFIQPASRCVRAVLGPVLRSAGGGSTGGRWVPLVGALRRDATGDADRVHRALERRAINE